MKEGLSKECVMVVGAAGKIGTLLARLFVADGSEIVCLDQSVPYQDTNGAGGSPFAATRWIEGDILKPTERIREFLRQADTLVFALSFKLLTQALPQVLPLLKPDCLVVETLSVKSSFASFVEQLCSDGGGRCKYPQPFVGINPMFSGDLNHVGRAVAAICYGDTRSRERGESFFAMLRRQGLVLISIDAYEHDRSMALLQTLVHAAVLSFGSVLRDQAIQWPSLISLAPPPFRMLLSLLVRMTQNHPDVYWEIQTENPYANEIREQLARAITDLNATCLAGDGATFVRDLADIGQAIISRLPDSVASSRRIFDLVGAAA